MLTGHVARVPSGGALAYRVVAAGGQEVGTGTVPVSGAATGSGTFNASLNFALPPNGGDLRVELVDRAADGTVATSATLGLYVQSQTQTITIDTPPPFQNRQRQLRHHIQRAGRVQPTARRRPGAAHNL